MLGDRKGIEKQTTTWDKTIIDRSSDLKNWVVVEGVKGRHECKDH